MWGIGDFFNNIGRGIGQVWNDTTKAVGSAYNTVRDALGNQKFRNDVAQGIDTVNDWVSKGVGFVDKFADKIPIVKEVYDVVKTPLDIATKINKGISNGLKGREIFDGIF